MPTLRTEFQCPDSGQAVVARFVAGRLSFIVNDDGRAATPETTAFIKRLAGRYRTLAEAEHALRQAGVSADEASLIRRE